jgi:hypothetical protein
MPNGERAEVDIRKLRAYCLNREHPRGKNKARVFVAALNWTAENAEELQAMLKQAASTGEAELGERDIYGQRYVVDFPVKGPHGDVLIRSAWIVRDGEDFPRLTTCYVQE